MIFVIVQRDRQALTMPALIGPVVGPVSGGFITTFLSWRWIFWINLPIGLLGIILATLFIDDLPAEEKRRFDLLGALLSGLGLCALLFGLDGAATASVPLIPALGCIAAGLAALSSYAIHARRSEHAIIDLNLLSAPTFRASVVGGCLFRTGPVRCRSFCHSCSRKGLATRRVRRER